MKEETQSKAKEEHDQEQESDQLAKTLIELTGDIPRKKIKNPNEPEEPRKKHKDDE